MMVSDSTNACMPDNSMYTCVICPSGLGIKDTTVDTIE